MAKPSSNPEEWKSSERVGLSFQSSLTLGSEHRPTHSPKTPYSERELLQTVYGAWLGQRWFMGIQVLLSTF